MKTPKWLPALVCFLRGHRYGEPVKYGSNIGLEFVEADCERCAHRLHVVTRRPVTTIKIIHDSDGIRSEVESVKYINYPESDVLRQL